MLVQNENNHKAIYRVATPGFEVQACPRNEYSITQNDTTSAEGHHPKPNILNRAAKFVIQTAGH